MDSYQKNNGLFNEADNEYFQAPDDFATGNDGVATPTAQAAESQAETTAPAQPLSEAVPQAEEVQAQPVSAWEAGENVEAPEDGTYRNAGAGRRESAYGASPDDQGYTAQPYAGQSYYAGQSGASQSASQWNPGNSPQPPKAKKEPTKKKSKGAGKVVAAAVAFALLGGVGGGVLGAYLSDEKWEKSTQELQNNLQSQINSLQGQLTTGTVSGEDGTATVSPVSSGAQLTPKQVYAQNVNSVVSITNQGVTGNGWAQQEFTGSGSGFILTEDGYVLTNYHVVEDAQALTVTTYDGTEYAAELIGYDELSDVALLKVDASGLPAVTIGSSAALSVGDQVCAIGNPLGELASSQTVGYVSAKDRTVNTDGTILTMIQTDAAINSGNSGGPLFNMQGEVVGITTAKYSGSTSSGASIEGIGFAIPIDDVMNLVDDLMEYGYVTNQAYLGVYLEEMDANVAQAYGLPSGPRVQSVVEGSCAETAGIQAGDIIIGLGDQEVSSYSDLTYALRSFKAGDTTTIQVYRSGQELTLNITLDEKTVENDPSQTEQPSGEMPEDGSYEEWYNYFAPFFGNN